MINNSDANNELMEEIEQSISDVYGMPGKEPSIKKLATLDGASAKKYSGVHKDKEHADHTLDLL